MIKVANTKAGLMLSASGVLGGALLHGMPAYEQWAQQAWRTGLLLTALALASASALVSLWVFALRLKVGEPSSLLYPAGPIEVEEAHRVAAEDANEYH